MFFKKFITKNSISKFSHFIWDSDKKTLNSVKHFRNLDIKLLIGVDYQKTTLLENTINFAKGNFTNNALLWGARGNGKSTLVKSIFAEINNEYKNLKLVQLNKNNIFDIDYIYEFFDKFYKNRFIIFIDDLSFEKIDSDYKIIKSTLDGSLQNQPKNIILYVTSNRRHLMPRDMIDNERSSAIHTDESVEEKISLSDRFGLWIGFHKISQKDYLEIVETYCKHFKISYNEKNKKEALQWSAQRGNRTGRSAWQYILHLAAKNNLKIKI